MTSPLIVISLALVIAAAIVFAVKARFVHPLRFSHSGERVTDQSFRRVRATKRLLLSKCASLFKQLGVRYIISDGNLLEYRRGRPIPQDDDIDFRVHDADFGRIIEYYKSLPQSHDDGRGIKVKKAFKNGFKIRLVEDNGIDMWADVVPASEKSNVWRRIPEWAFEGLQNVDYMGVRVLAPSNENADRILRDQYGNNFMKPLFETHRSLDTGDYVCVLDAARSLIYWIGYEPDFVHRVSS